MNSHVVETRFYLGVLSRCPSTCRFIPRLCTLIISSNWAAVALHGALPALRRFDTEAASSASARGLHRRLLFRRCSRPRAKSLLSPLRPLLAPLCPFTGRLSSLPPPLSFVCADTCCESEAYAHAPSHPYTSLHHLRVQLLQYCICPSLGRVRRIHLF